MTPSQIIALIRDVLILAALGFVIWWIWRSGEDRVKVADMAAVTKQLKDNAKALTDWQTQDAQAKKAQDDKLKAIADRVSEQHDPIIVRVPAAAPGGGSLPGVPVSAHAGGSPAAGGSSAGLGGYREENLRPDFNAAEIKYSTALAECRRVIATCKVPK